MTVTCFVMLKSSIPSSSMRSLKPGLSYQSAWWTSLEANTAAATGGWWMSIPHFFVFAFDPHFFLKKKSFTHSVDTQTFVMKENPAHHMENIGKPSTVKWNKSQYDCFLDHPLIWSILLRLLSSIETVLCSINSHACGEAVLMAILPWPCAPNQEVYKWRCRSCTQTHPSAANEFANQYNQCNSLLKLPDFFFRSGWKEYLPWDKNNAFLQTESVYSGLMNSPILPVDIRLVPSTPALHKVEVGAEAVCSALGSMAWLGCDDRGWHVVTIQKKR